MSVQSTDLVQILWVMDDLKKKIHPGICHFLLEHLFFISLANMSALTISVKSGASLALGLALLSPV